MHGIDNDRLLYSGGTQLLYKGESVRPLHERQVYHKHLNVGDMFRKRKSLGSGGGFQYLVTSAREDCLHPLEHDRMIVNYKQCHCGV